MARSSSFVRNGLHFNIRKGQKWWVPLWTWYGGTRTQLEPAPKPFTKEWVLKGAVEVFVSDVKFLKTKADGGIHTCSFILMLQDMGVADYLDKTFERRREWFKKFASYEVPDEGYEPMTNDVIEDLWAEVSIFPILTNPNLIHHIMMMMCLQIGESPKKDESGDIILEEWPATPPLPPMPREPVYTSDGCDSSFAPSSEEKKKKKGIKRKKAPVMSRTKKKGNDAEDDVDDAEAQRKHKKKKIRRSKGRISPVPVNDLAGADTEVSGDSEPELGPVDESTFPSFEALMEQYEKFYDLQGGVSGQLRGFEAWRMVVESNKVSNPPAPATAASCAFNRPPFQQGGQSAYDRLSTQFRGLKPTDLFVRLLTDNGLIDDIVKFTNDEAASDDHHGWKPLTPSELFQWIGLHLAMSLHPLSDERDYWRKDVVGAITYPNFGAYGMGLFRLQHIRSRLKFANYSAIDPTRCNDKAWKVRPLTSKAQATFRGILPCPGRFLSIDEAMVRCQGRCPIKCFMPDKPIKFGMKLFVCVDYETGIAISFDLDRRQFNAQDHGHLPYGMPGAVVCALAQDYLQQHRVILMDNYYTSVALARHLLHQGTYMVGTSRKDRCAQQVRFPAKVSRPSGQYPRGTLNLAVTQDTQIACVSYMDKGVCYMVDSFLGNVPAVVLRKDKGGETMELPMVESINIYNQYMGGVDQLDQLRTARLGSLTMMTRRSKWTVKYFEAVLDLYLVNAYRIYSYIHAEEQMTRIEFLMEIQKHLVNVAHHTTLFSGILQQSLRTRGTSPTDYTTPSSCTPIVPVAGGPVVYIRPFVEPWLGARKDQPNSILVKKRCVACFNPNLKGQGRGTGYRCSGCKRPICNKHPMCLQVHLSHSGAPTSKQDPYCPVWKDKCMGQ
jgi:hypothetical protein